MPRKLEQLAARVIEALEELRETAWVEGGGSPGKRQQAHRIPLDLGVDITPSQLAEMATSRTAEALSEDEVLRSGHVYCYHCKSSACEHAHPPFPGAVFSGYESTGRPCWQEFFNQLLELGDHRTERLFADTPETVSRVVGHATLVRDQLVSFGKNSLTYSIWGQVISGYVSVRGVRTAFTVQLVENRQRRLLVHMLAPEPLLEALANAPENSRSAFHRIFDAMQETRRQATSLTHLWKAASGAAKQKEVRDKAFVMLRHLSHSIERKGRQQHRRTAHAEARGNQKRPVHKAYDDLQSAAAGDFYEDRYKQSIIVVGKANRVHAFSEEGKHITSLVLKKEELEGRQHRKRYVPLASDRADSLRNLALATIPEPDEQNALRD